MFVKPSTTIYTKKPVMLRAEGRKIAGGPRLLAAQGENTTENRRRGINGEGAEITEEADLSAWLAA